MYVIVISHSIWKEAADVRGRYIEKNAVFVDYQWLQLKWGFGLKSGARGGLRLLDGRST